MKFDRRNIGCVLIVFLFIVFGKVETSAQSIDAFARVLVTPREGVVRQSYKVTITVHSSTWFAKPLQFANLHIDDAFIIPFSRTVSSINYINKKKYATLSFYYLIFPYNTGNIEIPELALTTSIPPEGGYKGEPVTIRTKPQIIKVKSIPTAKDEMVWMVADNVNINESWSKSLENLKVGDVIEREIIITANGTLPSLILPLEIKKPKLASIYPKEPVLQDKRNNEDVNGIRIEKYAYLFEEETEIVIPEETILWWNPTTKKVYKRTIPEKKLTIASNPDLAMMKSLKDSLMAMSATVDIETEEKTFPWLRIGLIVLVLLFAGYFGTKTIQYISRTSKKRRAAYLRSETYYFKKAISVLKHKSSKEFIREMYIWFDKARKPEHTAAIYHYLNQEELKLFESVLQNSQLKGSDKLTAEQRKKLNVLLQGLRTNILTPELLNGTREQLNPV